MYLGQIVEEADVTRSLTIPCTLIPWLIESSPQIEENAQTPYMIKGIRPPSEPDPSGCGLHPVPYGREKCRSEMPELVQVTTARSKCWNYAD
jgi:ABC-type dipeptide/oligopeptide/nickel transport system ATPase component